MISNITHKLLMVLHNNATIIRNIVSAFIIKGGAVIVSFLSMPAYLHYFKSHTILGVWFTILSLINWVFIFDLGIGNGLRNKLVEALANNEHKSASQYITSSYISITIIAIIIGIILNIAIPYIPWNYVFNVDTKYISTNVLILSMRIILIGIIIQFVLRLISNILYALQKSAMVNLLAFITNLFIYLFVYLAPDFGSEKNIIILSGVNILAANIPLIIATIIVFMTSLKDYHLDIRDFQIIKAKEILNIGLILLWLQFCWMVIAGAQSILITNFISPQAVVEYQIYFKIFNTIASLFVLALIPIWSAVTKAHAEKNYNWIIKLNQILLFFGLGTFLFDLIIIPLLQFFVNIWLGESAIRISWESSLVMAVFNSLFVLHNVNTSISNGMSWFKIQNIWMAVAAITMIPLSYLFCKLTGSWTGVIIGCSIAILPYEIIQPLYFKGFMKSKIDEYAISHKKF